MVGMSASTRSAPMPQRRSSGSWKPGQSGNPKGRAPAPVDIAALARAHGARCIEVAAELLDHEDARIRLGALVALLDRGYGRPVQAITSPEGSHLHFHLEAAMRVSAQLQAEPRRVVTIEQEQQPAPSGSLLGAPLPLE